MKRFIYLFPFTFLIVNACQPQEKQAEKDITASDTFIQDTLSMVNSKWIGIWEREGSIDPATLTISDVNYTSFNFHISTHDGLKAGEISGKAAVEEDMALFISTTNKDTCNLSFILQDSLIVITQSNDACSGALGLDFSGEYYEERYFKEKVMEEEAEERSNEQ